MQLGFKKHVLVATDNAPAIVTSKNRFVFFFEKYAKKIIDNKHDTIKFHCIIHQEALYAKSPGFADVMKVVVKAVNFLLSCALNRQEFQDPLAEVNTQYNGLLYFCEVHFLRRGEERNSKEFLTSEKRVCNLSGTSEVQITEWIGKLAFLTE